MKVLAVQQVGAAPDSLLLLDSPTGADGSDDGASTLFLHIGKFFMTVALPMHGSA